jgi:hypothetical protein
MDSFSLSRKDFLWGAFTLGIAFIFFRINGI